MKRISIAMGLVMFLLAMPAVAERPVNTPMGFGGGVSMSDVKATPAMWFYEQELRRYSDPKVAVREKAALRGYQRQSRIAAMRWFGKSNQRPTVNPDPYDSYYAPTWAANNGLFPIRSGTQIVIVAP